MNRKEQARYHFGIMEAIQNKAKAENRQMTDQEITRWKGAAAEIEELLKDEPKSKELRRMDEIYSEMAAMRDRAKRENRQRLTVQETKRWNVLVTEFERLETDLRQRENQYARRYRKNPVTAWLNSHLQHAAI